MATNNYPDNSANNLVQLSSDKETVDSHALPKTLKKIDQVICNDAGFRKLIENIYEGLTLLDRNLQITYRSNSAERINGWSDSSRLRNDLTELIHPDDKNRVNATLKELIKTPGESIKITFRGEHVSGNYIWLECVFKNFLHDRDINSIVCNFRDISDVKHAEELFQKTINELSAYKHALDESAIVAITDQTGIIKHVNDNFCRISKFTAEELIGHDHRIINSGYHTKEFVKTIWTTIANGKIWKGELKNKAKDGSFYWVDTTIVPFLNEKGKPYQYVAIRSDITERIANQEKIIESERFIKIVTDNLPTLIAYWTADLNCLLANKPYVDWFERTADEMIGINKKELMSAEDFISYKPHINGVLSGKTQRFERTFLKDNGSKIFTHTQYLPDFDGTEVKGFYSVIYDITEIKLAEERSEEAQMAVNQVLQERNIILESITDAFFAVDKNWTVTYWNQMAEKISDISKTEMLNHNLWEVFSDVIDSESYVKYHEAVTTQMAVHFEEYYANVDKWYEISAYPSDSGLSVYLKDVTERKISDLRLNELNENLQKKAKELVHSNAELEQFAYIASHDLQEPLRMITSFLSQLEKKYGDIVDDKGKQYIHFAVDGAKRMRQIILDLLEFSRIGAIDDDLEEVNLSNMVAEITALYRKKIEEERAKIISGSLPTLLTHKTPVRQVLQNLIGNALKYHKKNIPPIIHVSATETTDKWQIAVSDNGIGIESEYFDKIFIIFQRLHAKNEYPGTGMGLAIAKKIIENLGGTLWVESEVDKGSTFYFTILKNLNHEINKHITD